MNKRIAFVTGGDRGIGYSIVESLVENDFHVLFTYNVNEDGAREIKNKYGSSVHSFQCNVLDKSRIMNVVQDILTTYSHVNVVVNNLGAMKDKSFVKMTAEEWETIIDINLKSIFYMTHDFVPGMIANQWGRIINISSIAAQKGAFGKANYCAAKAGMIGFTKALAIELASKGITVNAIAPGAIDTDMYSSIPEKFRQQYLDGIPMKRVGKPSEVADVVSFLVSDKAAYITGQLISVNGGAYL